MLDSSLARLLTMITMPFSPKNLIKRHYYIILTLNNNCNNNDITSTDTVVMQILKIFFLFFKLKKDQAMSYQLKLLP